MPTRERRLALDVLIAVSRGERTLGDLLAAPQIEALAPQDRGFLHELTLGTLRHRGALDHALATASDRPLEAMQPEVLEAVRLGAYQILFMRVPDHASVSQTVDLVRDAAPRAAGFANAVLRRLARTGMPAAPDPDKDPIGWLTTEGSLPRWLAARWVAREGAPVAVARARALLSPAPITFRLNPGRPGAAALVEEAGLAPRALELPGAWLATSGRPIDLAREGVVYLQDLGSQVVARLAALPGRVLDACAAPGGKALLIADTEREAQVTALEVSSRRLHTMRSLIERWGAHDVRVVAGDAGRPPFRAETFDTVLLDAPCSGLGTLGRNPDLRWRASEADVVRQSERQRRLIRATADLVKSGGRLVYSACTLEPEETDAVVRSLTESRSDFAASTPPAWAAAYADGLSVRVRPERHPGDGFFAAVLTRR